MRKLLTFLVVALACVALVWITREYPVGETLSVALPGLWTALIAIVSGAGGAMLLELWLKPKIQRRNAAVVLAAEIIQNGYEISRHVVTSNEKSMFWMPDDFRLSMVGFGVVANQISALHRDVVRRVLVLYARFEDLNQVVTRYWEVANLHSELADDDPRRSGLESDIDAALVVFHSQMKTAFEEVETLARMLKKAGGIKDEPGSEDADDFRKRVKEQLAEQEKQKTALKELRRRARQSRKPAEPG